MPARQEVTTLVALLARQAQEKPDATAFIQNGCAVTFAEFDHLCERTAAWLAQQGIGPGDRVAVWLVNRIEWLALYFGLARRGAAIVAVNTRYRAAEVQHLLSLSRVRMLVTQLNFRGIDFPGILAEVDGEKLTSLERIVLVDADSSSPRSVLGKPTVTFDALASDFLAQIDSAPAPLAPPLPPAGEGRGEGNSQTPSLRLPSPGSLRSPPSPVNGRGESEFAADSESRKARQHQATPDLSAPDLPSTMFTTSGTTKGPKLVVHPQRTIALHAQRCATRFGFDRDGATLIATMPFCGTYGLIAPLAAFAGGAPAIITDTFDAENAAALMHQHKVTHAFWTDDMLRRLGEVRPGDNPFPAMRIFGFAAFSPGASELALDLWQRGFPLFGLYGSSEVGALFSIQPAHLALEQRIEGGGQLASPDGEVRIRDLESGNLLPPGESGEIEIKAPTNFLGYFENPQATAEAVLADGFFRTGDVGRLRPDGTFVYESRRDDSIRLAGFLVNPAEIEDQIKELPGVADVQVVAVKIGERMRSVAFVIPAAGASLDPVELITQAAILMAPYRAPARVWLIDSFPATQGANGTKIQRGKLRELANANLAAEVR